MATAVMNRAETNTALEVFRDRLVARRSELANALKGTGIDVDRFIRTAISAVQNNSSLLSDCSFQSLWAALQLACRDGLEPDGRQGVITVYGGKAKWQAMYRGMLDRFQQTPDFKWVTANLHRSDDLAWDIWVDETGQHFLHRPGPGMGDVIETYAAALTKSGGFFISVVTETDMEHIKSVSRAKSGDAPWQQWPDQMRMKSALKRLCKLLPMPQPLVELMSNDDLDDGSGSDGTLPPAKSKQLNRPRGAANALQQFADGPEQTDMLDENAAPPTQPESGEQQSSPAVPQVNIDTAYERGKDAKRQNFARKALPPEYREADRDREASAWRNGWDGVPLDVGTGNAGQQ